MKREEFLKRTAPAMFMLTKYLIYMSNPCSDFIGKTSTDFYSVSKEYYEILGSDEISDGTWKVFDEKVGSVYARMMGDAETVSALEMQRLSFEYQLVDFEYSQRQAEYEESKVVESPLFIKAMINVVGENEIGTGNTKG